MKQFIIIISFLSFLIFQGCEKDTDKEENIDSIEIISVSPSKELEDGVEYNFNVEIEYDLITVNSGILMIGFNTEDIDSYLMLSDASVVVDKGAGNHTFLVTVKAKDWMGDGDFIVYVNLSENPHPPTWSPLNSDEMSLNFKDK